MYLIFYFFYFFLVLIQTQRMKPNPSVNPVLNLYALLVVMPYANINLTVLLCCLCRPAFI